MAAGAFEDGKIGEHPGRCNCALRHVEPAQRRLGLPDGPGRHRRIARLALEVVGILDMVRRSRRGERVELDHEPWMSRGEQAVRDRVPGAALVAAEAQACARARVVGREHSVRKVFGVRAPPARVAAQPAARAAVAGLAAHAVRQREILAAPLRRDGIRVALQASALAARRAEAQLVCDRAGARTRQGLERLRVLVLAQPDRVFVLLHDGERRRLRRVVASALRAVLDAQVHVGT
jgi:hypothetical protein